MSDPVQFLRELRAKRMYEHETGRLGLPWSLAPERVKQRYRERVEAEEGRSTYCEIVIRGPA